LTQNFPPSGAEGADEQFWRKPGAVLAVGVEGSSFGNSVDCRKGKRLAFHEKRESRTIRERGTRLMYRREALLGGKGGIRRVGAGNGRDTMPVRKVRSSTGYARVIEWKNGDRRKGKSETIQNSMVCCLANRTVAKKGVEVLRKGGGGGEGKKKRNLTWFAAVG